MKQSFDAAMMAAALRMGQGATRTREEKHATFVDLHNYLKSQRFGVVEPQQLSLKHVRGYVEHLKERGVGVRSIQNRLSHIRCALRGEGMGAKADSPEWANPSLGVVSPPGSRLGKHRGLTNAELAAAQRAAAAWDERGREFAVLSELQASFGLRAQEAVQSAPTLSDWQRALQEGRPIQVIYGTKGGRPRATFVPNELRPRAQAAVDAALKLQADRQLGHLVASANLQAARDRYRHTCAQAGLSGEISSHGLRYAWAAARYREYRRDGLDDSEALRRVSLDLGHGDGRGRYISSVYLRGVER